MSIYLLSFTAPLFVVITKVGGARKLLIASLIAISLLILVLVAIQMVRQNQAAYYDDDILADSIAIRGTGNPEALSSAIVNAENSCFSSNWNPRTWNPDRSHFFAMPLIRKAPLVEFIRGFKKTGRQEPESRPRREAAHVARRLENLREISHGRWAAFEAKRGRLYV